MTRLSRLAYAVPLVLAAACTSGSGGGGEQPQQAVTATVGADGYQDVTVDANDQYRFVPDQVTVKTGKVRLTFKDVGNTPHNLTFDELAEAGKRVTIPTLTGGAEKSTEFTVSTPGEYRFVCTIHESLGQTGALTVTR